MASVGFIFAESGTCGENLTWDLTDGVLTISGFGAMNDFAYPSNTPWYAKQENISQVVVNYGVTSIGSGAFWSCTNLESIELPNSLTNIGDRAFCYCSDLRSIDIPDYVVSIGEHAFDECFFLSSVHIGNSVESIANDAFYNCYGLSEATIGSGVTNIGDRAFGRCFGLTYVTILCETPPELGLYVFSDAANINNLCAM
jgi:hypothetical protein